MDADYTAWFERELERRRLEDDPPANTGLLPVARFSDEYAPEDPRVPGARGAGSSAVRGVLAGACAGWGRRPDAHELHEAMQAAEPTQRQLAVGGALLAEATPDDILLAYLQGAFTWRQLARLMHRRGRYTGTLARYVNLHAEPRQQ